MKCNTLLKKCLNSDKNLFFTRHKTFNLSRIPFIKPDPCGLVSTHVMN